jgi:DNA-binding transcriptional ArsR family regulator
MTNTIHAFMNSRNLKGGSVSGMADDDVLASATALARELADPVRLLALQVLASEGPRTASALADELRVTAPRLGNHLARLRDAGLVAAEHSGRHAVYRLADARAGDVVGALFRYAGGVARPPGPAEVARTCYDHVAGQLGVRIFAQLVERGALRPPDGRTGELTLGPDPAALRELGVEPEAGAGSRRKAAVACLDRTYRLPHLGGRLGGELLAALLRDGAVTTGPGTRTLTVTRAGRRRLAAFLP